jgi:DNA-binding NarL/FixJ family response regulator
MLSVVTLAYIRSMEPDDTPDGDVRDEPVKPGTIRVVLADSQAIYRVGIRKIFGLEDDIRVVAQAESLENLRAAIERHPCDVVLVEGELLTGATNSIPELLRIAPDIKLIVQAVSTAEDQTVELYRRGIRGIISRSISPDLLVRCVRCIASGETWIDNYAVKWLLEAYRGQEAALASQRTQPRLSPKETAIITCITQGMRNKEIAFQMGTSEQVIKNYLRKIYDKLGVADRLELALYGLHNKIIKADADKVEVVQRLLAKPRD